MKAVLPNTLGVRNLGVNGVRISLLLQGHVKTRIKERNILHPLQLFQTRSHNQQRRIIMSIISTTQSELVESGGTYNGAKSLNSSR